MSKKLTKLKQENMEFFYRWEQEAVLVAVATQSSVKNIY